MQVISAIIFMTCGAIWATLTFNFGSVFLI